MATPVDVSDIKTATQKVSRGLKKRYAAEQRFRRIGLFSIGLALLFLVILLTSIVSRGWSAFTRVYVQLDVNLNSEVLDITDVTNADQLGFANYNKVIRQALRDQFPDVTTRSERRNLNRLVSVGAEYQLKALLVNNPQWLNTRQTVWVLADDDVDSFFKGNIDLDIDENDRRLNDQQVSWLQTLSDNGQIDRRFNRIFFTAGDSREPELAGIRGALIGSLLTLSVTLLLSFPIGVAAAVYLEEFAPRNRLTDIIEVNINNLAAVPSIVFGLLGLAIFINFFNLPRSAPLVGGLVLTLMTLPTIIIASRAALKSVPPSIREAALGVGASRMQMVMHHVLPLALPGMLTGTIIGMAQALGETAPLLMIGMVAFIVDVPQGLTDPATALPVQIYLWSDSPERSFTELTSAAIMVLLVVLAAMNSVAVLLRKRFERQW